MAMAELIYIMIILELILVFSIPLASLYLSTISIRPEGGGVPKGRPEGDLLL